MSEDNLRDLLARVHEHLAKAGSIDPDSRALLATLVRDIERTLHRGGDGAVAKAAESAPRLEALAVQLETEHPALVGVLREFIDQGRTFDAIVLDPPKFAPTAAHAERAARAYKDINRLALKLLEPGGVLLTFSCSGGISADLFHKIVASAGIDAGVDGYIAERLGAAPDHPMTIEFPEGEYLKGLVVVRKPA